MINGREAIGLPPHRIAHLGIGYCPEERGIFSSLSCEENLLLPPEVASTGLSVDEIDMFPNLKERRMSQGTRLSGGGQQMLAVARILRTGAQLLLLDEFPRPGAGDRASAGPNHPDAAREVTLL
jgi:branched-chain amino acid transport system ATP-binding protein